MVEIHVLYEGDLHNTATHGPSGRKLETDAPVDNEGRGESFSPTDLVATALAACMTTIIGIVAKRHQLDVKGTNVRILKGMSQDSPRRIAQLTADIHIPLPSDHPKRALLEAAALGCPVYHSLHPSIDKKITFHFEGTK